MLYGKHYPGHWKYCSESQRQDLSSHGAWRLMGETASQLTTTTKNTINKDPNAKKTKQGNAEKELGVIREMA